jgi:hypothetical protein
MQALAAAAAAGGDAAAEQQRVQALADWAATHPQGELHQGCNNSGLAGLSEASSTYQMLKSLREVELHVRRSPSWMACITQVERKYAQWRMIAPTQQPIEPELSYISLSKHMLQNCFASSGMCAVWRHLQAGYPASPLAHAAPYLLLLLLMPLLQHQLS